jgi:hypothetical protein
LIQINLRAQQAVDKSTLERLAGSSYLDPTASARWPRLPIMHHTEEWTVSNPLLAVNRRVLLSTLALLPALQSRLAAAQETKRGGDLPFSFAVYGDSRSMMYLPYKSDQREEATKADVLRYPAFPLLTRSCPFDWRSCSRCSDRAVG